MTNINRVLTEAVKVTGVKSHVTSNNFLNFYTHTLSSWSTPGIKIPNTIHVYLVLLALVSMEVTYIKLRCNILLKYEKKCNI